MRMGRFWKNLGLGLLMSAALVVMQTTDVFAVAGKIVDTPSGVSLAGGSVELDIGSSDGSVRTFEFEVTDQGALKGDLPAEANKNNIKDCRYRGTDGKVRNIRCGALLFSGGSLTVPYSAISEAGGTVSAGTGSGRVIPGLLRSTDFVIGGAFITALGTTSGSSESNFANTSGEGNHLHGAGFNFLLRSFIPVQPAGISLGGFFEFDQFFGVDGTSGLGVHHLNPAVNDTNAIRTVRRAFGFGVTQVIPIGAGFWLDLQQGFAVVQQRVEGVTNQSSGGGPTEHFRNDFTHISPKLGASLEYQPYNLPFRIRIASEFIYLPTAGVTGFANFSGSPFHFSSENQWLTVTSAGIVIPLSVFSREEM